MSVVEERVGDTMGPLYAPASSPDTSSPVFPGRPIRPLPQRSLRARLPEDAANAISFPPATSVSFSFPDEFADAGQAYQDKSFSSPIPSSSYLYNDQYEGKADEWRGPPQSGHIGLARAAAVASNLVHQRPPHESMSAASSADSYDSIENTNNKKRKIPTPSSSAHHSHLSSDLANLGLSSAEDGHSDLAQPGYALHNSGSYGYSGPGRGRYGRHSVSSSRSPLGVSINGSNAWSAALGARRRQHWSGSLSPSTKLGSTGPSLEATGSDLSENVLFASPSTVTEGQSVLDQHQQKDATKTQFTFTYESTVPTEYSATYPEETYPPDSYPYDKHGRPRLPQTPTRNMPAPSSQLPNNLYPGYDERYGPVPPAKGAPPVQPQPPARKSRSKRAAREAALATRQRRLQENLANSSQHPEDFWICEFCEYESIFGSPPEALVRQYDIKEREERKRLAKQKRLLEKAKMKGRKNRKGAKVPAKAQPGTVPNGQAQHPQHPQSYAHDPAYDHHGDSQTTQSDDYDEEEYLSDSQPVDYNRPMPPLHVPPGQMPPPGVKARSEVGPPLKPV